MKINWKFLLAVVLIAAGATGVALNPWTRGHVVEVWKQLSHGGSHGDERPPDKSWLVASTMASASAPGIGSSP